MLIDREGATLCAPCFARVTRDFLGVLTSGVYTHEIMSWNTIFSDNLGQYLLTCLPGGGTPHILAVDEFFDKFYVANVDWNEIPPKDGLIHHPVRTLHEWGRVPYEVVITIAFVFVRNEQIYFTGKSDTIKIMSADIFANAEAMAEYEAKRERERIEYQEAVSKHWQHWLSEHPEHPQHKNSK